jgi:putative sigma-54 modulation protein
MQIDIKGRNVPVTDDLRAHAEKRLTKVARQVSDLARLEIEIFKEPNPRVADCHVAEGTLYLKGVTLRASDASPEMLHSLNLMVDELARQVKRHRDKLRHRREAHATAARAAMGAASPVMIAEALRPATEGRSGGARLI